MHELRALYTELECHQSLIHPQALQSLKQVLSVHETIFTEVLQVFKPGPGESASEHYKAASSLSNELDSLTISIRRFQDTLVRVLDTKMRCKMLTTMSA